MNNTSKILWYCGITLYILLFFGLWTIDFSFFSLYWQDPHLAAIETAFHFIYLLALLISLFKLPKIGFILSGGYLIYVVSTCLVNSSSENVLMSFPSILILFSGFLRYFSVSSRKGNRESRQ